MDGSYDSDHFASFDRFYCDDAFRQSAETAFQHTQLHYGKHSKTEFKYQSKRSRIKEFDDVIDSLLKMKDALQASLAAQWEAERIKKEQIGALAHDIKIPATIIKGNAELLQLTEPDEEQAEYAQYILDAGNKIEHYVGQLIQLSKAEEAVAVHVEYTDLKEWIQNIYRDAAALAGPKQIDLVLSERGIDRIEAPIDHESLHRAVMNIAANAVDYTPEGGKSVWTSCAPIPPSISPYPTAEAGSRRKR